MAAHKRGAGYSDTAAIQRNKSIFALIAVAMMLVVPMTTMESAYASDPVPASGMIPIGKDYGFILTTGESTIAGTTGQTITAVDFYDKLKQLTHIYTSTNQDNILYTKDGNQIVKRSDSINPNNNSILDFNNLTGLGPFNSFYAAVNLYEGGDDPYRTSTTKGQIAYILNPDNLDQAIVSTANSTISCYSGKTTDVGYYSEWDHEKYNIILLIPTVYWYSESGTLWMSNKKDYFDNSATFESKAVDSENMVAYAHTVDGTVRPFLGLGVYESSLDSDGSLVSKSGKTPATNKNLKEFRDAVDKLNDGLGFGEYMVWNYYQWTLYKMMSYTVMGTKNSQLAIGQGLTNVSEGTSRVTGNGDQQGAYWGGVTFNGNTASGSYTDGKQGSKLFLENAWGANHEVLDDTWMYKGQLYAGQNSADVINSHVSYIGDIASTTGGYDNGLNTANQEMINGAAIKGVAANKVVKVTATYEVAEFWDLPSQFANTFYEGIGDSLSYKTDYQTLSVGGNFNANNDSGINRINVRNDFGKAYSDITTRIAYVNTGGVLTFDQEDYTVKVFNEIVSGQAFPGGVTLTVSPNEGHVIQAMYLNGIAVEAPASGNDWTFMMPNSNAHLSVVIGDKVPVPVLSNFTYDGTTHSPVVLNSLYQITGGTLNAKDAGTYSVTIKPAEGYYWQGTDNDNSARDFTWKVVPATLHIEGAADAKVSKMYNMKVDVPHSEVTLEDLHLIGLVANEVPTFSYTKAEYNDKFAVTGKTVTVSGIVLGDNGSFKLSNYSITVPQSVKITSSDVKIVPYDVAGNSNNTVDTIGITSVDFDGTEHILDTVPLITINDSYISTNMTLTLDKDYRITYLNNRDAGTATVLLTCYGNYSGVFERTFTITQKVIDWPAPLEVDYDGEIHTDDLTNTEYYTVTTHASGSMIGEYSATLSIIEPTNVVWKDGHPSTGVSLVIRDVENTITYDTGDGWWKVPNYPTSYMSSEGVILPVANAINVYTKTGYNVKFVGWKDADSLEVTTSIPTNSVGDRTFIAVYSETIRSYDVIFNMNGHGTQIPSGSVTYGGKIVKPTDPTDTMYDFIGWYKTPGLAEAWNFQEDTVADVTQLYAKWELKKYTVTWKNGEELLETDLEVDHGSVPQYNDAAPTKEEDDLHTYVFDGWMKGSVKISDMSTQSITSDTVYTASFSAVKKTHTVNYSGSGLFSVTNLTSDNQYTAYRGEKLTLRISVADNGGYSQLVTNPKLTITYIVAGTTYGFTAQDDLGHADGKYTRTFVSDENIMQNITLVFGGINYDTFTVTCTGEYNKGQTDEEIKQIYSGTHQFGTTLSVALGDINMDDTQYHYVVEKYVINGEEHNTISNITVDQDYTVVIKYGSRSLQEYHAYYTTKTQFTISKIDDNTDYQKVGYGQTLQFKITVDAAYTQLICGENPRMEIEYRPFNEPSAEMGTAVRTSYVDSGNDHYAIYSIANVTTDLSIDFINIEINSYTVTWQNEDGTTYAQTFEEHGGHPTLESEPAKAGTSDYRYVLYWTKGGSRVADMSTETITADTTYRAGFDQVCDINIVSDNPAMTVSPGSTATVAYRNDYSFTITINEPRFNKIESRTVKANGEIITPDGDGKYTLSNITSHKTVVVTLTINTYSITWNKEIRNGTSTETTAWYADEMKYPYGYMLSCPYDEAPSIDTAQYVYKFLGWKINNGNSVTVKNCENDYSPFVTMEITSDLTITAVFQYVGLHQYTLNYDANDYFVIQQLLENDVVSTDSTIHVGYGEDLRIRFIVTNDRFSQVVTKDGKLTLGVDPARDITKGIPSTVSYNGLTKHCVIYTIANVTNDMTLTLAGMGPNTHEVTWMDGSTKIKESPDIVVEGTPATPPAFTKTGYLLNDLTWSKTPDGPNVQNFVITENTTFYAHYSNKVSYTVTLQQGDGYELKVGGNKINSTTVLHGDTLTFTLTPVNSDKVTYALNDFVLNIKDQNGNDIEPSYSDDNGIRTVTVSNVTKPLSVSVDNTKIHDSYKITWKWKYSSSVDDDNFNEGVITTVKHGSHPIPPAITTVTSVAYDLTFDSWKTDTDLSTSADLTSPITSDQTFYALINKTLKQYTVSIIPSSELAIVADTPTVAHGSTYQFVFKVLSDGVYSQLVSNTDVSGFCIKAGDLTATKVGEYYSENQTYLCQKYQVTGIVSDTSLTLHNVHTNTYTVQWKWKYDNTLYNLRADEKKEHGSTITNPYRSGTNISPNIDTEQYNYTFSKWTVNGIEWDGSTTAILSDTVIVAEYSARMLTKHTISFSANNNIYRMLLVDTDNDHVTFDATNSTFTVDYGYSFTLGFAMGPRFSQIITGDKIVMGLSDNTAGTVNKISGYTNEDLTFNNVTSNYYVKKYTISNVTKDAGLVFNGEVITINTYTITWIDNIEGSSTFGQTTSEVRHGNHPVPSFVPSKPATADYWYRAYWVKSGSDIEADLSTQEVTSDMTYYARFQAMCDVTFTGDTDLCTVTHTNDSATPLASGGSYSFTITGSGAYSQLKDLVVKANGIMLTPTNGEYTISNITSHQTIDITLSINQYTVQRYWKSTAAGFVVDKTHVDNVTLTYDHGTVIDYPPIPVVDTVSTQYTFDHFEVKMGDADPYQIEENSTTKLTGNCEFIAVYTSAAERYYNIQFAPNPLFTIVRVIDSKTEEPMNTSISGFIVKHNETFNFRFKINDAAFSQIITNDTLTISASSMTRELEDYTPTVNKTAKNTSVSPFYDECSISDVSGDIYLTFGGIARNAYTVTWLDVDGTTTLATNEARHGANPVTPEVNTTITVETVEVISWLKSTNQGYIPADPSTETVTSDVTYKLVKTEEVRKYTISWVKNGVTIHSKLWEYGSTPVYDGTESTDRAEDSDYIYTFAGWSPSVTVVSGDAIYNAVYTTVAKKYTVTWQNYDNSLLEVDYNVIAGSHPLYNGVIPTKPSTAQYRYTFKCWAVNNEEIDISTATVSANTIYTAKFEQVVNKYTITWVNSDRSILEKDVGVEYGSTPTYDSSVPKRSSTAQYSYTFTGWSPTVSTVAGDTIYIAQYTSSVNSYTVKWLNHNGSVIKEEVLQYGTTPSYTGPTPQKISTVPYMKNTFTGWSPGISSVKGDVSYTAQFAYGLFDTDLKLKVSESPYGYGSIKQGDNSRLSYDIAVRSNAVITPIEDIIDIGDDDGPATVKRYYLRIGDTTYEAIPGTGNDIICSFLGWYIDGSRLEGPISVNGKGLTVEAKFDSRPSSYSVYFGTMTGNEGYGGFVVGSDDAQPYVVLQNIPNGSSISVNEGTDTIPGDTITVGGITIKAVPSTSDSYAYSFVGWFYSSNGNAVRTGDLTGSNTSIYAEFTRSETTYQITWKDSDGITVLATTTVLKGTIPDYPYDDPYKPAIGGITYTFAGWSPELSAAGSDTVYVAQYSTADTVHIVTVDLDGGVSTIVKAGETWHINEGKLVGTFKEGYVLNLGTVTKAPTDTKEYSFSEWRIGEQVASSFVVNDNLDLKAIYNEITRKYTVTWLDNDGTILDTTPVEYNSIVTHADPVKYKPDGQYAFVGWFDGDTQITLNELSITQDKVLKAKFDTQTFTVTLNSNGGSSVTPATITVEQCLTYGQLPTPTWSDYDFLGWYTKQQGGTLITSDTVFHGTADQTLFAHWEYTGVDPGYIPNNPDPTSDPTPDGPEIIINPDGSITEKEKETIENPDGSITEKEKEKTANPDGSSTERIEEKTTNPDGETITKRTDIETDSNGNFVRNEETEFHDGGTIGVVYTGNGDESEISNDVDVGIGDQNKITDPQAGMLDGVLDEVKETDKDPNVIIKAENPTEIPKEVLEKIVNTNGSLIYIENSNIMILPAEVIKNIGIPNVSSVLSIHAIPVPEEHQDLVKDSPTYDIGIHVDDEAFHDNFSDLVKVQIVYDLKAGQSAENLKVYYLYDGGYDILDCTYADGYVKFYLPHMSCYSIVYEGSITYEMLPIIGAAIAAIVIAIAAVAIRKR